MTTVAGVNGATLEEFREILLAWGETHRRIYPWRELQFRTPYAVAIAELMLRRTRADQVRPVFSDFIRRYPTLESAACADEFNLKAVLHPLGLTWRIENIVSFVKTAYARFGNDLQADRDILLSMPGVGEYVSEAVLCFTSTQQGVLIDTNVVRVLGRYFGLDYSGEARRRKTFRTLAREIAITNDCANYHYSLLDFAASICRAKSPYCEACPLQSTGRCSYYLTIKSASTKSL